MTGFDGATYNSSRDHDRLTTQLGRVRVFMSDGEWHSLREIAYAVGAPEASVSARLRDLRKDRFGGQEVEHLNVGGGSWVYRLSIPLQMVLV